MKAILLFAYLTSLISQPTPALETERIYPTVNVVYDTTPFLGPLVVPFSVLGEDTRATAVELGEGVSVVYAAPLYALPMDWDLIDQERWGRPHHDYPALDVQAPVGTPVFAIRGGKIGYTSRADGACGGTINLSTDIGQIMYCHLSGLMVRSGDLVETGQLIGYSGGRPGSLGAGSSTVAHLHIGLTRNGRIVCIQPLLVSLVRGEEPDFTNTTRCSN